MFKFCSFMIRSQYSVFYQKASILFTNNLLVGFKKELKAVTLW